MNKAYLKGYLAGYMSKEAAPAANDEGVDSFRHDLKLLYDRNIKKQPGVVGPPEPLSADSGDLAREVFDEIKNTPNAKKNWKPTYHFKTWMDVNGIPNYGTKANAMKELTKAQQYAIKNKLPINPKRYANDKVRVIDNVMDQSQLDRALFGPPDTDGTTGLQPGYPPEEIDPLIVARKQPRRLYSRGAYVFNGFEDPRARAEMLNPATTRAQALRHELDHYVTTPTQSSLEALNKWMWPYYEKKPQAIYPPLTAATAGDYAYPEQIPPEFFPPLSALQRDYYKKYGKRLETQEAARAFLQQMSKQGPKALDSLGGYNKMDIETKRLQGYLNNLQRASRKNDNGKIRQSKFLDIASKLLPGLVKKNNPNQFRGNI